MYCSKCGCENSADALYCEKCGEELTSFGSAPAFFQKESEQQVFKPIFVPANNTPDASPAPADAASANPGAGTPVSPVPGAGKPNGIEPLYAAAPAKKKSRRTLWIAISSILLVLVIAGGLGFAFRMQIMKTVAPKQYLQTSLARTLAGAKSEAPDILNLGKYAGKAVSHDFTVDADEGSLDGSFKYDAKNEKALLDISVDAEGTSYKNNQLYISPDLVALSMPDVIDDAGSLTVNPKTLADDWAAKGWDDQNMPLSDLEKYIHMFFGKNTDAKEDTDTVPDEQIIKESAALWKNLYESAVFSSDGPSEEKIRGEQVRLDSMTYTIDEDDANDFLEGFIDLLKDQIKEQEKNIAGGLPAADYEDQINSAFDELKDVEIDGDVVVHFYIDSSGYVRKISTEDVTLTNNDSDADIAFSIEFGKGARPTDDMSAVMTIEADGNTSEAALDCKSSFEDGVYSNKTKLTLTSEDNSETSLSLSFKWDKTKTSGENLAIRFKGESDDESPLDLTVKGLLKDGKMSTSLTDAVLEVNGSSDDMTKIDFSYSITVIDPSEISMDLDDSTPLLDYEPFTDYMDAMYS